MSPEWARALQRGPAEPTCRTCRTCRKKKTALERAVRSDEREALPARAPAPMAVTRAVAPTRTRTPTGTTPTGTARAPAPMAAGAVMPAARTPAPVLNLHHRVCFGDFALNDRGLRRNGSSLHGRSKQSRACDRNRNDVFLHLNRPCLNAPFLGTLSIWYAKKKSSPPEHDILFMEWGVCGRRLDISPPRSPAPETP
jgi:hypothetical protein